jgi:hypothetical protein
VPPTSARISPTCARCQQVADRARREHAGAGAAPYQVANEPPAPIAPEGPLPADIRDWTEAQDQAYRAHLGLTDADMDRALAEHQAQQAAWCASGGAAKQPDYCAQVLAWLEAH